LVVYQSNLLFWRSMLENRWQGPTEGTESDAARQARLAWFKRAKYGLFIHLGLYAIPAGEWRGKRVPATIPVAQYEKLASQWNPTVFNAEAWVQMAQDSGTKYMVITSKHHDGFAMFDSKVKFL
jgi:alpha-L-fucosidase